jgi:hypothetical protein
VVILVSPGSDNISGREHQVARGGDLSSSMPAGVELRIGVSFLVPMLAPPTLAVAGGFILDRTRTQTPHYAV